MVAASDVQKLYFVDDIDPINAQHWEEQAKPLEMTQPLGLHGHIPVAAKADKIAQGQKPADTIGLSINNQIRDALGQRHTETSHSRSIDETSNAPTS